MDVLAVLTLVVGIATLVLVAWGLWRGSVRLKVEVQSAGDGIRVTVTNRGGRIAIIGPILLLYGDPEDLNDRRTLTADPITLASLHWPSPDPKVHPNRWTDAFDARTLDGRLGRTDAPGYLRVIVRDASPVTVPLPPGLQAIIKAVNSRP